MRVLVTGGAGFVGRHLVDDLVTTGRYEVVVMDNLARGRFNGPEESQRAIEFLEADVRDRESVRKAMKGVSFVFHLAAQSNVLGAEVDRDYSFSTNVGGTVEVLQAAAEIGVRSVVFTSSREVYGEVTSLPVREDAPLNPKNAYGASKAAAEHYCRVFGNDGVQVNVLRLANVYGPQDHDRVIPIFLERALDGHPLVLYGGEQILDFVWIGTVVDALKRAAFGPVLPGPLNVGCGAGTRIRDLAERILEMTGSRSALEIAEARCVETVRFVADTTLAGEWLGIETPEDPLFGLGQLMPRLEEA